MLLYIVLILIAFIPSWIFLPTIVKGRKNLKTVKKGGVIFAANHQSWADIPLMVLKIPRRLRFVAKKEILKSFWGRFIVKGLDCFAIERGKPNIEFYKKAIKTLENGKALMIFPEGTRRTLAEEDKMQLKNGIAMFAIKTKSPICPVFFKKKPKFFRLNKMIIGEPFTLPFETASKENLALATKLIAEKFENLRK